MKKSIWTWMFAFLFTVFPILMFISVNSIGQIKLYNEYGLDWDLISYLLYSFLASIVLSIMGSVLSWKAYSKNKSFDVLRATILMGVIFLLAIRLGNQVTLPLIMIALGVVSYFDVNRILKQKNR